MLGRACVAHAECQHKLGQLEGAVETLETFLQLSHSRVSYDLSGAWCWTAVLRAGL
jgi:hypothetical protein